MELQAQSIAVTVTIAGFPINLTNNENYTSPIPFSPTLINNVPLTIKNTSSTIALTLSQNCAPAPCTYITASGTGATDFTINQSSITGSIAASSSQNFYVSVSATATNGGPRTATYVLHTNDPSNPIFTFSITYTLTGVLPVQFISYNGQINDKGTLITWTVTNEYDNRGYFIERSTNGITFDSIGFISGLNSSGVLSYQFTDKTIEGGAYYKIVQQDFNGTTSATSVFYVASTPLNLIKAYPNPFNQSFSIVLPENMGAVSYTVSTLSGQYIDAGTIYGSAAELGSTYPPGIYLVHFISVTESSTARMIKK